MDPIPHDFRSPELARLALTHSSTGEQRNNERLEFLGDAALDLIVAEELYEHYPDEPEGLLTERKSSVVSRASLAEAAREMGLDRAARVGRGLEKRSLSRAVLANLYEALIGAVYLDAGLDAAREFAQSTLRTHLDRVRTSDNERSPKQVFQEHCQREWGSTAPGTN